MNDFSCNLKEARLAAGLSIKELADRSGVSYGRLLALERSGNPKLSTILSLAKALGVPAASLLPLQIGGEAPQTRYMSAIAYMANQIKAAILRLAVAEQELLDFCGVPDRIEGYTRTKWWLEAIRGHLNSEIDYILRMWGDLRSWRELRMSSMEFPLSDDDVNKLCDKNIDAVGTKYDEELDRAKRKLRATQGGTMTDWLDEMGIEGEDRLEVERTMRDLHEYEIPKAPAILMKFILRQKQKLIDELAEILAERRQNDS